MPVCWEKFWYGLSRSASAVKAAIADNCRFDERVAQGRWQQFEDLIETAAGQDITFEDWAQANKDHYDRYVTVSRSLPDAFPDAFLEINRPAWLTGLAENQTLVRIERLERPLAKKHMNLDDLIEAYHRADNNDNDAVHTLRDFLETWNQARDRRPIFAAFLDEVQTEADSEDWPHALRDRLGLGHYDPKATPIPVALMRYSLKEVLNAQDRQRVPVACALPTVLDGGIHEFFFPVPRDYPYGSTLHLAPERADVLTAEILHFRFDYRSKHLWKLGQISHLHSLAEAADVGDAAGAPRDAALRHARDLHLLQLRIDSSRHDFGEDMVGRR